jgi:predicted nucleotidyltransferase
MKAEVKIIDELIIKKISVYCTSLNNMHLLETVHSYIENNKDKFIERSWNCNIKTSKTISPNILYDIEEFNHLATSLENIIKELLYKNLKKYTPFMIFESWINILGKHGYQETHRHGDGGSAVLYLTENNSEIEFIIYPEDCRKIITPKKGDVLLFDGPTYHRVVESKHERMSLAFNFNFLK